MSKQALQHKLTLNIVVDLEGPTKYVSGTRQMLELAAITAIESARDKLSIKKQSRVASYAMQSSTSLVSHDEGIPEGGVFCEH
ncbi:hypothetical protein ACS8E9_17490 [Pseudomonas neustonica]|uniref:hypothetical protein n=1 Tax=Pseudomonas neustonica TaxID=2487346 RepID=UPI003F45103E|tara:strand:- start:193 stop:441 length:249 start_codon:yes stop_codon:yes gene_type:complete